MSRLTNVRDRIPHDFHIPNMNPYLQYTAYHMTGMSPKPSRVLYFMCAENQSGIKVNEKTPVFFSFWPADFLLEHLHVFFLNQWLKVVKYIMVYLMTMCKG